MASSLEGVSIPFIAGQWSLPKVRLVWGFPFEMSQSPSLRGSGRFFLPEGVECDLLRKVSIPFIAGQWSLPHVAELLEALPNHRSQSPSLRGSGRFLLARLRGEEDADGESQSPSLRGSGRFVSSRRWRGRKRRRLNPLHCGAVVASLRPAGSGRAGDGVSIPFIAGQWSLRGGGAPPPRRRRSQSPSLRGSGRFIATVT